MSEGTGVPHRRGGWQWTTEEDEVGGPSARRPDESANEARSRHQMQKLKRIGRSAAAAITGLAASLTVGVTNALAAAAARA